MVLVAVIPLAALAVVTSRSVYRGLNGLERELQVSIIHRVADAVSGDLDYVSEAVHRVGRTLLDANTGDPSARVDLARDAMARTSALLHVAIYTTSGQRVDTIYRTNDTQTIPPLEVLPAAVVADLPRAGRWLPAEFVSESVAIRYVEALATSDGDSPSVVVVGTLSPMWLGNIATAISRDQYRVADRVLLTDSSARLLAAAGAPPGTSLAAEDIFRYSASIRTDIDQDFGFSREYELRGEPMVGTLYTFRRMNWFIAVRRPEREAFATLVTARQLVLFGALGCAALAALLGVLLAGRTTRPIAALVDLTRAYAARHFAERSTVKSGDELEVLGASLEGMADNLQASEAEIARRRRVEHDLSRFLPAEVAEAVSRGEQALALGGVRRSVAVLFADVASFTSFAESAPPEKVVAFLNEMFTVITEVVFRHGGMIDKFIGDCVMAVFGTGSDPRDAETVGPDTAAARALAAAEDIHRFVEANAPAWQTTYGINARLGVGVNLGEALVGNLGSESRMEYTVIGDVVNVAARLESLARGGQTLVTGAVARAVGASFNYNPLGAHPLRGKREMVEIFEVSS